MENTRLIESLAESLAEKNIECIRNAKISPYTSFNIGGIAKLIVFPKNNDEAVETLKKVSESEVRYLILGNGSNVLVSDEGFDGVVVILSGMKRFYGIISEDKNGIIIGAEAGMSITRLASEAAKLSLSGLEFAYGIPGTVGGGIYMNAGAYGGEISHVAILSRWFDMKTGEIGAYEGNEHDFRYRHSAYTDSSKIVLSAEFKLNRGIKDEIEAKMNDYMSRRREKQPLEYPSAGSVFKRGNGFITAELIEGAGLKGRRVGGAEVSQKHAGFIVNRGGATAADVLELIDTIQKSILEKYGKRIECEVRYIPK